MFNEILMEWSDTGARVKSFIAMNCPRCGFPVPPNVLHLCGDQVTGATTAPVKRAFRTRADAAKFIARKAYGNAVKYSEVLNDPAFRKRAYRSAARRTHPDHGGLHEQFVRLQAAMEMLEKRGA